MEQLKSKSRFKRRNRWQPTLRQLLIRKVAMAYRLGKRDFCIETLERNGITVYEFLRELANMEKRSKK
jgi:hypothetical protein